MPCIRRWPPDLNIFPKIHPRYRDWLEMQAIGICVFFMPLTYPSLLINSPLGPNFSQCLSPRMSAFSLFCSALWLYWVTEVPVSGLYICSASLWRWGNGTSVYCYKKEELPHSHDSQLRGSFFCAVSEVNCSLEGPLQLRGNRKMLDMLNSVS